MKRNSIVKSIALSVTLSVILAGCGGSSASKDDISSLTINGKAIDGYLQYATVCLDLSQDGYCQESEPTTQTTQDGSFNLEIKPDIQTKDNFAEAMLLVYGGKDVDTGEDFRGKLLAPLETEVVNISPITTLVAKAVQKEFKKDAKLTKEQMRERVRVHKEKIAKIFDIEVEDITKDPVALKDANPKLIKEALKIQKSVEAMSRASANSDNLEEVYERLVEKLKDAKDAGGIDALLDSSFADDKELLKAAKAINKNIEKSFEMFAGDLEKVAFITKEDLKKIKEKRFDEIELSDEDDRLKPNYEWDNAFIKSGLEDIGIKNPTKRQIDKIKEIGGEITPRVILENIENFKDSEDSILREISEKIEYKKEEDKKRRDIKKAKNDGKIVKFEKGMSFFDFYPREDGYEEIKLGENALLIKEYYFRDGSFGEYDIYSYQKKSYILKKGKWIEEDKKNTLSYNIDDNGIMTLTDRGYKVTILNQEDISGQNNYSILMPEGSFVSVLKVEQLEDQYRLFDKVENGTGSYSTISEYVRVQCEKGNYKANNNRCDKDATKGETTQGEWSIETRDDVEILVEKDNNYKNGYATIFALKGETLYKGGVDFKGVSVGFERYINSVAIDAYKEAITTGKLPATSPRENIAKGEEIYTTKCASCHGVKGEKSALDTGAIISSNSKNEIVNLLKGYKYDNLNQYGMGSSMKGQAVGLSNEDIESIALYIKSL